MNNPIQSLNSNYFGMPNQRGVVFCMYAGFKINQGVFGAFGVREGCYSFPQRSPAAALREVVLRDVSNLTDPINKKYEGYWDQLPVFKPFNCCRVEAANVL
jgi:hypothetical protein